MKLTRLMIPLSILVASGCASDVSGGGGSGSIDGLPRLELVEELRVGSVDDPDLGFSILGSIIEVAAGDTIYVAELSVPEFRVYGPNGQLVRRIGRRGEGPGEMRSITAWGVLGDTLWTVDLQRITLFRRDGTLIATVPITTAVIQSGPVTARVQPRRLLPDGRFTGGLVSYSLPPAGTPPVTLTIPTVIFDQTGVASDTVGFTTLTVDLSGARGIPTRSGGMIPISEQTVPTSFPLGALVGGDSLYVLRPPAERADAGVLTVLRLGTSGDTLLKRDLAYVPRPVEPAFQDSVRGVRIANYSSMARDPGELERMVREMVHFSEFHPPVASIAVGVDESIWLRRDPEESDGWHWTVLAPDATPIGEAVTTPGTTILWTDGSVIYLSERDAFDVPWVVRYRLVPSR